VDLRGFGGLVVAHGGGKMGFRWGCGKVISPLPSLFLSLSRK